VTKPDRRHPNPPRIPFVRRCWLGLPGGAAVGAFTVNISAVGAYLTRADFAPSRPGLPPPADELPQVGQTVVCRLTLPDSETELQVHGTVTWLNSRQQHPVHSLPPGFGLRFDDLSPEARQRIDAIVAEYLARIRS
jgi:Tfp pilus assembly protein PilZ